jgi:hypothetical protein
MPGKEYLNKEADHWVRCHLYGPGEEVAKKAVEAANQSS